jgi:signal transduction histidine kinase
VVSALELIALVNQVLFVGLFVVVLWHALRQPTRTRLNTVLLFGAITGVLVVSRVLDVLGAGDEPWALPLAILVLNAAPFAMIRLVDDFGGAAPWVTRVGTGAFVAIGLLALTGAAMGPTAIELASLVWFLAVGGYAAVAFARIAARSRGITRRRMAAVSLGAGCFVAAMVLAFAAALAGTEALILDLLIQAAALTSGIAFFLGFAPPAWLRRAWREPYLRSFLERSIHLTGEADDRRALMEIQQAAATAFGAPGAGVGLADSDRRVLRYLDPNDQWIEYADDAFIAGRAFTEQRRIVSRDTARDDPEHAALYERRGARTIIAAPVTVEDRRLGVLVAYADRSPVFVEDDLWLIELLADQMAVLLEARTVTTHASALRAREDAARLKEEFLSAAAHDLRTPLTVVLGQAELIERRLSRDPGAPVDPAGIARMAREARRLRDLVSQLLDAQRLEQGLAIMDLAPADLGTVAAAVHARHREAGRLAAAYARPDEPSMVAVDLPRIEQVIENLLENARKYGAADQPPELHVWIEGDEVRLAVVDHGQGIPESERERIFERFYRPTNAQGADDTGMGLGLYICRRIVEDHGGRIWADATPGGGATFTVALPRQPWSADEAAEPPVAGAEAVADA